MSSPTFKPPTTTSSAKDSPTTIVFNSLSPINMSASRPSCQAFDNVDVPSPQPVFSTPQNCLMNSKRCKRFQTLVFPSPPKIFQCDIKDVAASLEYPDLARQYISMPIVQSKNFMDGDGKYNSDHHSQDRVCRSPSNIIDEYLSIPSEDCENNSGSSGILLGKADYLVHDKEMTAVSSNVDPMAFPNDVFSQVPLRKSSSMITNSSTECTEHLDLVSMPNMQPDKVILPEVFQNNSIVHKGSRKEFLVINNEERSNVNVFGQNSSCQPEKNPARKKASDLTKSTAFEEIGTRGGSHGKKPEKNFNSFLPSVFSTKHEPIALDRRDLNTDTLDHGDECPSTSSSYLLGRHDANLFSSRAVHWAQLECTNDAKNETPRNTQLHTSHHGISIQTRDTSAKSQIPYDQEDAVYHSRCMYKRLQFENIEKRETRISDNANNTKLDSSHFVSETTALPSNAEIPHVSNTESITTPERVQPLQSIPTNLSGNTLVKTDSFEQSNGLSTATTPRSSGIGLHLNAIGVPGQMSSHIDMEMPMEGLGTGGKTFLPDSRQVKTQVLKNMKGEMPVQLVSKSDDSSFVSKGECSNKEPSKPPDPIPNCHSPLVVKSLVNDRHITPFSRERLPFEETSKSEDSTQTSHGKKRRRKVSETEGQKRCNCKRSKCLKLYCDCFAAGLFCNEACACQGCSNNSEHEEMVSSTKQLIETRNPLAFAPKVVHAKGDQMENGDNKHITPPSARHKRGCNCKKSKCLKRYCECYQAGVGCSLGCRCEGCKNAYGTKDECNDITERVIEHQKPMDDTPCKEPPAKSLEVMHPNTEASNTKQFNKRSTLAAPLIQGINAKGGSILHLCASLHPSPESNVAALSSLDTPTSTMTPKGNSAHSEKIEEPLCIISNQQFDFSSGSMIDSLSPPWNGFAGLDRVSPPSGHSPTHCGSSSISKTGQVTDYEGKVTIKPSTSGPDYNLADESPEILRDDHSPINTVKVSSPNKKRISPPKKKFLEAGSSFSPGLKSGRKYVLHSISQFPSLTPYRNNLKEKSSEGSLEKRE